MSHAEGQLNEAIQKTGVYQAEYRIILEDNKEVRWMNDFGRVTERAAGVRIAGVMFDITEQKRQRSSETILSALPVKS
ncbi:MAG: hypothetical protein INR73_01025 [Williamsia sp.]|nr:hypothetical protein [Williamsia sp.]